MRVDDSMRVSSWGIDIAGAIFDPYLLPKQLRSKNSKIFQIIHLGKIIFALFLCKYLQKQKDIIT
jgi:hypothetical protein